MRPPIGSLLDHDEASDLFVDVDDDQQVAARRNDSNWPEIDTYVYGPCLILLDSK